MSGDSRRTPPRTVRRLATALAAVVLVAGAVTATEVAAQSTPGSRVAESATTGPDVLIRADVLVRGGRLPEARTLLNQVVEQFPSTAWEQWGKLGLGFLELARGRITEARPHYEAVTGRFDGTASVVLALLDGQEGKTAEAAAVLEAFANDPTRSPSVQAAAGLGSGYVRYWAGAYDGAALAFAAVADRHPQSPLADDALYGLARSLLQLGDATLAEQVLERVAEMPAHGLDDEPVRPALRKLSLREILRATRERYASMRIGQADQMLVALLDVNGRALATGSLAAIAKREGHTAAGTSLGDAARRAAAVPAQRRTPTQVSADAPIGASPEVVRASDGSTRERDRQASDPASEPPDGTPEARRGRHVAGGGDAAGASGGAGRVVALGILGAFAILLVRRVLPALGRAASRPVDG